MGKNQLKTCNCSGLNLNLFNPCKIYKTRYENPYFHGEENKLINKRKNLWSFYGVIHHQQ